ncbi:hypothetical protein [Microvirga sp. VF16]|uniref:hypothetical protein n=1 Tax=Microvirga sp. VF16 TaxID=2807101 RepID=UPI00193CCA3C|nr:hypothetical protein [Microvirga sp. VF16]QRM36059.1 hypothetical protein JO965_45630 [Microvirga sp. VF16]
MQNQASCGGKTERFNALVAEYGLEVRNVCTLLGRNRKTFRASVSGKTHASPGTLLELLELKLAQRPKNGGAEQ